jgi:hypothetical protein
MSLYDWLMLAHVDDLTAPKADAPLERTIGPSRYHLDAGRSLEVADAGQQVRAGWTPLAGASAVAALSCCTRPLRPELAAILGGHLRGQLAVGVPDSG